MVDTVQPGRLQSLRNRSALKFERALMRWLLVFSVSACFVIMYFFFFPDADRILNLGVK